MNKRLAAVFLAFVMTVLAAVPLVGGARSVGTGSASRLDNIKNTQLVPWLEADLSTLTWAWGDAAAILDAGVP